MAESSFVQLRIDNNLKQDAIDVLDEIGIDMPTAIRMFLKRVVLERRIPFDTQLPARAQDVDETEAQRRTMQSEYIPATPAVHVSETEYYEAAMCKSLPGKVTRRRTSWLFSQASTEQSVWSLFTIRYLPMMKI